MKQIRVLLIVMVMTLFLVSCKKESNKMDLPLDVDVDIATSDINSDTIDNQNTIPLLNLEGIVWTQEEKKIIVELNKKGYLKVATKINSAVYQPREDDTIDGFHYNVINEFVKLAQVTLDIQLVSWDDYFYKEGEDIEKAKVDAKYSYVPTLIDNVDLYIDGITSLPWREKLFDIIKFVPSKQMLIARKGSTIKKLEDLDNNTCAMVKNSSLEFNLEKIEEELDIKIDFVYSEEFDDLAKMVSDGIVDFTVADSDAAFATLIKYNNLTIVMPISDVTMMGWAINKNNKILNDILVKYLSYAQENNILDKYWKESYGVSFVEYLKILQYE